MQKTLTLSILLVLLAGCAEQDYSFDEWMQAQDWYEPNTTETPTCSAEPDPDFMRSWHEGFERRKDRDLLLELQRREHQFYRTYNAWQYDQSPWLGYPDYYWQENLARQEYLDSLWNR